MHGPSHGYVTTPRIFQSPFPPSLRPGSRSCIERYPAVSERAAQEFRRAVVSGVQSSREAQSARVARTVLTEMSRAYECKSEPASPSRLPYGLHDGLRS